ncbi:hypothetical protein RP20_CCG009051 [Aedes albopictus]|nr:hypothetical protein RP20_CCG009051 [Aedes albopictus]
MCCIPPAENVFQTIAPCEAACKLFGLIPVLSGVDLPTWKKFANFVHFLVTITLLVRAIWYCLPAELNQDNGSSVAQKSGEFITIVYYLQPICASITSRLVSETTYQLFTSLEAVDNKFQTIGFSYPHNRERMVVVVSTVAALSGSNAVLLTLLSNPNAMDVEFSLYNIYFVIHFSLAIHDVQIARRHEKMYEEQQNILKQLKLIMDKLDSTVQLTNRSVSIQVLYCVGVSFVIGIVCSFYLFRAVIYRNDQLVMGVVNFVWYMYYISFVLFFIAIGSRISHEGQRIGITVHKAINFCNTSRTVINEMLGATATYLIILIQFDVSFPSLDAIGNLTLQE